MQKIQIFGQLIKKVNNPELDDLFLLLNKEDSQNKSLKQSLKEESKNDTWTSSDLSEIVEEEPKNNS